MNKKVAIHVHPDKPEAQKLAVKLRRMIARRAAIVSLDRADLFFVIGGDGTILRAAADAARHGVPMVGINVGKLGFLAELTEKTLSQTLGQILAGKFTLVERRMIEVWDTSNPKKRKKLGVALNEMLLVREGLARIAELSITIGGEPAGFYSLDGVIVSTPTGSTGHALAAGGPVLSPKMRAFLIVPLCPHPPRVRPMVVEEEDIDIEWNATYRDLTLSLDGYRIHRMPAGTGRIKISPAPFPAKFVRLGGHTPSFFNIVRQKLI